MSETKTVTVTKEQHILTFAVGEGTNLAKVVNHKKAWPDLVAKLLKPNPDKLSYRQYADLPPGRQAVYKYAPGFFISGPFNKSHRLRENVRDKSLITLDVDQGSELLLERLKAGTVFPEEFEYVVYSTRSHNGKDVWKFRVIIPLAKPTDPDVWMAASRVLSSYIDQDMLAVDPVSFRSTQVMYFPATSRDIEQIGIHYEVGDYLDAEPFLDQYGGDWHNIAALPRSPKESAARDGVAKAGDPREKNGHIGAFCRRWDIWTGIAEFLSDIYEPTQTGVDGTVERYTYKLGRGSNGAEVFDNGQKFQSWHGTDPATEQNVHIFDLIRIHRFGELDNKAEEGTRPQDMPSYKAMLKWIEENDPETTYEVTKAKYDVNWADEGEPLAAPEGSTAVEGAGGVDTAPKAEAPDSAPKGADEDPDWTRRLAVTAEGVIRQGLHNLVLILTYAAPFKGKIAFDEFAQSIVILKPIMSKSLGIDTTDAFSSNRLTDRHRVAIRHIIESPSGKGRPGFALRVADRDLTEALLAVAQTRRFHPVRDWLDGLKWDGKPRLKVLLSKVFGTPQDAYHEWVGKLLTVAAVARTYQPGCKFDYLVILEGPQGIGKSRFIVHFAPWPDLAGASDGHFDNPQKLVESIKGRLIVELPELQSFNRTDVRAIKNMLSSPGEQYRVPYAHEPVYFPRQCVMIGTTNEEQYLRDETGNRRMWPVKVVGRVDLGWLEVNREQLYAEAVTEFHQWRDEADGGPIGLFLPPEAERIATGLQSARMVHDVSEDDAGVIGAWLETSVTAAEARHADPASWGVGGDDELVQRTVTCGREIWAKVLDGRGVYDQRTAQTIAKAMKRVPGWVVGGTTSLGVYGHTRTYRRLKGEDEL